MHSIDYDKIDYDNLSKEEKRQLLALRKYRRGKAGIYLYGSEKEKQKHLKHYAPNDARIPFFSLILMLLSFVGLVVLGKVLGYKIIAFISTVGIIAYIFYYVPNYIQEWKFLEDWLPGTKDYRYK